MCWSTLRSIRSAALALTLTVLALGSQDSRAQEPAHIGNGGASTTAANTITGTAPDVLVQKTVNLGFNHTHTCNVAASADTRFGGDGTYVFGLSVDSPGSTAGASNRLIEYTDNSGVNDPGVKPVATVLAFPDNLVGTHTFYFSARKASAAAANMIVTASSMIVTCTNLEF